MTAYDRLRQELAAEPRTWLITGAAGFIGSHLLEELLALDQRVTGLDNLSTGAPRNLEDVRARVSPEQWARFTFHEGSVADMSACRIASDRVDFVLHHAGFVSVPLSIEDPLACHATNVTGMLNLLIAARDNRVRRIVYASSSAVYGDNERPAKIEPEIGRPLSPYGASKRMGEIYARLFSDHHGLETIGLRYFNIFGPRQNPFGGYAAVIPQWIATMLDGGECVIHGDGTATRDFCPVANVVQANLLAATTRNRAALGEVFNVASGHSTSLKDLHGLISAAIATMGGRPKPVRHGPPRPGDILHSAADINRVCNELGYDATATLAQSLDETVRFYAAQAGQRVGATLLTIPMRRELPIRANSASVVTVRIVDTAVQYLILRRASEFLRDQWCHVGGAVEPEESAWQAVLRELREETGLVPERLYSADRFEQFYRPDWDALVFAPVFTAFVSPAARVRLNHEHSEFRWCSREEALSLMVFFTQRANLLHVDAEFIQRSPNELLRIPTGSG